MWGSNAFIGVRHAPILRGRSPSVPNIFGTFYVYERSMRNNNQILDGDQTRCEQKKFYTVDQKC